MSDVIEGSWWVTPLFSRKRGTIPSGTMSFSLLAPKELTQWADVRAPLATSQMQTIEPWPTSKENFWSHGIALASQKCITRPQLSTIVSLHKEGKDRGGGSKASLHSLMELEEKCSEILPLCPLGWWIASVLWKAGAQSLQGWVCMNINWSQTRRLRPCSLPVWDRWHHHWSFPDTLF